MATKFYLHRATANPPGTFPAAGTALGGTPTVTASGAGTLRWLDGTISAASQTSAASTTNGTSNAQTAWHTRHVSAPLAAQTISAQTITYSLAASEGNAASNFNPSIYISLWRPGTGAEVGAILAVGTITATEPGTGQTAVSGTGTSTARTSQAGDVVIIETWRKSVAPGATTARVNTTFYDGTTEASTTNVASFVNFANTLTFQAIAPAPTAGAMTLTGSTPTVVATDNKSAAPTAAAATATGATPTVTTTNNVLATPTAGAMTATGATPTVSAPVQVSPSAGQLTSALGTPTVSTPVATAPTAAAMSMTGSTPAVVTPVATAPTAGAMTATGGTPVVATPVAVAPTVAEFVSALATPIVTAGANVTSTPSAGAMTATGATPDVTVTDNIIVTPDIAALNLSLFTPTVAVTDNQWSEPTAAALISALFTPTVTVGGPVVALPTAAALAIAFATPTVTVSGAKVPVAAPFQGGLMPGFNRAMAAVPYHGPTVSARIIEQAAIDAATARFAQNEEDDLLLLGD